jgi:hypothetical protein
VDDKPAVIRRLYPLVKYVILYLSMDFSLGAFALLDGKTAWAFWASWGYAGLWLPAAALAASLLLRALLQVGGVPKGTASARPVTATTAALAQSRFQAAAEAEEADSHGRDGGGATNAATRTKNCR